jgi:hypothetical protein
MLCSLIKQYGDSIKGEKIGMGEMRNAYRIFVGETEDKLQIGSPRD